MAGTRKSGRKPTPTRLKALAGNPGKRALNNHEPQTGALTDAVAPDWLDPLGKAAWTFLCPRLIAAKVLTETDLHNLEAFCAAYSRWRRGEEQLATDGLTITNDKGTLTKHPAATIVNEALRQMTSYGAALGLSPADRGRIKVPGGEGPNPFNNL